jgi:hypothetical protein
MLKAPTGDAGVFAAEPAAGGSAEWSSAPIFSEFSQKINTY